MGGLSGSDFTESIHTACILVQPVFDSFADPNRTIVGSVISTIPWDIYLSNLVQDSDEDIVCVMRNTCGDTYTYQITGPTTTFLGKGDLHDTKFDNMVIVAPFAPFLTYPTSAGEPDSHCEYTMYLYPSQEFQNVHSSNKPAIYTAVIVIVFVVTGFIFIGYDMLVKRRQARVHSAAVKSSAIVSSLFPAEIRERLFEHNKAPEQAQGRVRHHHGMDQEEVKNILSTAVEEPSELNPNALVKTDFDDKPIADLFPNTTVMFADIAGFTAWSSVREPSQVFTLLETVYRAFDRYE